MTKKLLLLLFLLASPLAAQQMPMWDEVPSYWVELNGGSASLPVGSVTSVGISAPSDFNISGSPVTTAGTLTLTWAGQAQNLFLLAPVASTGAPTFRAIDYRDIFSTWGDGECLKRSGSAIASGTCAASSGAPTDATYITQTANGSLSAEQALSSLSTGIMRVATTTGVVTSLTDSAGIAANISDETGTGLLTFASDPTFTLANVGNGATGPGAIDFLEDSDNGTNHVRLIGQSSTADITVTLPAAAGTITTTTDKLSAFSATTSAEFFGVISDETGGSGAVVGAASPALTTPSVGNGATGPGYVDFLEDTDNGSNRVRLIGPSSTADVTATLPASTGTVVLTTTNLLTKATTIENPGSAEKAPIFNTTQAMTITGVCATLIGSSTPSVTYNIKYGSDLSAAGTSVTTSPTAVTSTTSCTAAAALNNTAPAANDHVWLITTAQSGTVNYLNVTITYTIP